jgi:hypothetical protein
MTVGLIALLCCMCMFLSSPANTYGPEVTEDALCHRGWVSSFRIEQASLPKANITIILKDRIAGTTVIATAGLNFTSDFDGVAIGFVQYPLFVIDGNNTIPVSGLDYASRGEYLFAYAGSVQIINSSTSDHSYSSFNGYRQPSWSIGSSEAKYVGPIRNENISQLTEVGFILQYDGLALCFANGTSRFLGTETATIGVNFMRSDDGWSASFIIDMPGVWVSAVSGSLVTIDVDGWAPVDPDWTPPPMPWNAGQQMFFFSYSGLLVIMAVVVVVGVIGLRRRRPAELFESPGERGPDDIRSYLGVR